MLTLMVLLMQLASVVNSQVISIAGGVAFLLMVFNMALFFFFKYVCMYLLAVVGLSCCMWAFSSCGEQGLLSCCAWASRWSGFSCGGAGALGRMGFSSCRAWAEQLQLLGSRAQAQ